MATQIHSPRSARHARILIVDDEADLRELLELSILRMGHEVESVGTVTEALEKLTLGNYQLVLTDMRLPDGMGLEIVRFITESKHSEQQNTPVAVITAYGSADNAVEALKAGAFDYVAKPIALEQLRQLVQNALGTQPITPASKVSAPPQAKSLLGQSPAMDAIRATLQRFAASMAPVVIYGESGSGKERAARTIHEHSSRKEQPFIPVNCGAIPENLMEAEFFGYMKGAFTGAEKEHRGFFQAAHGGTLLLDEVADLPLAMQVKLLRAIQERKVRKVGATAEEAVDVRILSATHKNLGQMVEKGLFRQDLYYRLNVLSVVMPPLRERPEDILSLATHTLNKLADRYTCAPKHLSADATEAIQHYAFPGNVRELENILERAWAFAEGDIIYAAHFDLPKAVAPNGLDTQSLLTEPPAVPQSNVVNAATDAMWAHEHIKTTRSTPLQHTSRAPAVVSDTAEFTLPLDLQKYLGEIEGRAIEYALSQTGFNRTHAAKLLGLTFRQLRYRMQQLGIKEEKGSDGIDSQGWWLTAQRIASPNFDERPRGTSLDLIVLHNISLPPGEFDGKHIEAFFCNQLDANAHPYFATIAGVRVSAHFLITRSGVCKQFVACQDRAWHAGLSDFMGRDRCNDFSIGIELEGTDTENFTPEQYDCLAQLVPSLLQRYPTIRALAGHSDIAPSRKTDPGPHFDWQHFANLCDLGEQYFPYGITAR